MMKTILTFITLYGLSFSLWGCLGLCRYFHEHTLKDSYDRAKSGLLIQLGALISFVGFWISLSSLEYFSNSYGDWQNNDTEDTTLASALIQFLFVLWAIAGSYIISRIYNLRLSSLSIAFFGSAYWICVIYLLPLTALNDTLFYYESYIPLLMLGLALLSGWQGILLANSRSHATVNSPDIEHSEPEGRIYPNEVAVLIPAHNEEKSISYCLNALKTVIDPSNVYVGSDGSTDRTVDTVRKFGCQVLDLQPNRGKARTLTYLIEHFSIVKRYKAVLILDADSELDSNYLNRALPLFDDSSIVAIAGHAIPKWHTHTWPRWSMFFIAYRVRLYKLTQALLRYGQTWTYTNVSFIIPGFASMYRCSILPHINIAAPGLIIEDFNMTFELHHKRLGKIAYLPSIRGVCQDPMNLNDYLNQLRRWYLGFWQTVKLHGFWPSFFWISLGTFILEMLLQSLTFLTLPFILTSFILTAGEPIPFWFPLLGVVNLTIIDVAIGVFMADYILTIIISILEKKPQLVIYGLGFVILRWIDACLFLFTLPLTFFVKSDGRWVSPARVG